MDAPVRSKREVEIVAPPEVVWEVLTGFEQWPQWNPEVKTMSIEGPVEPGTEFRWKAGPGTIVSTLEQVDPPGYIRWRGRTLSVKAIHEWRLEPANGGTRVETDESFSGLLARLFRGSLQKTLDRSTERGLPQPPRPAPPRAARSQPQQ